MSELQGIKDLKVADENAEVIIKFDNVCKTYTLYRNDQERFKALFFKPKRPILNHALDHVSFEVRKGEAIGIMGDNGSGKSTMLKTITGVTFPDEGTVHVKGVVAALLELTAGFSLEMTGRENIYLKGYVLGLNDEEIKDIEERVIEFAELGDYIDQPVRTYSSGMKMRLGFAINVNIEPDILVVDEALSVGDAAFRTKCKTKIKEVIQEKDVTVLYVSHNPVSVKEICPRSIYLKKGHVIFDGPTEETHLVYLVDKRSMQINRLTNKLNGFKETLNNTDDENLIKLSERKITKISSRTDTLKEDLEQNKKALAKYRKEHYDSENISKSKEATEVVKAKADIAAQNAEKSVTKKAPNGTFRKIVYAAASVLITGLVIFAMCFSILNARVDFESVYREIGADSKYCVISDDGNSMTIDSNPEDISESNNKEIVKMIHNANKALGLPESFFSKMKKTQEKDGVVKYDYSRLKIQWKRSAETGLEVTYTKK